MNFDNGNYLFEMFKESEKKGVYKESERVECLYYWIPYDDLEDRMAILFDLDDMGVALIDEMVAACSDRIRLVAEKPKNTNAVIIEAHNILAAFIPPEIRTNNRMDYVIVPQQAMFVSDDEESDTIVIRGK